MIAGAPSSRRIRDRDEAGRWLAATLACARVLPMDEALVRRALPWLAAALDERPDLPPVGVVADLGALLEGEDLSRTRARRAPIGDARLDAALRRWEDVVLARLGAEGALRAGGDAIARLSPELRARGVGLLTARVAGNLGLRRGVALLPGMVRAAAKRPPRALLERGAAALRDDPALRDRTAALYEALARGAESARALVADADVFLLENLPVLERLEQRLAIAQIAEARDAIAAALPRRIRPKHKRAGATATKLEDESEYPIGGFSSMSSSGSIENLVTSELAYMEPAGAADLGYDLFDVRYAEGELLYYTRDEAQLLRQRRVIDLVLMDDLTAARVKDPALPWQRLVLLLGAVRAAIEKLLSELGAEDLRFRVVFAATPDTRHSPLVAERALTTLALREWREKGVATVLETTLDDEADTLSLEARRARTEVVLFTTAPTEARARWSSAAAAHRIDPTTLVFDAGLSAALPLPSWADAIADLIASIL